MLNVLRSLWAALVGLPAGDAASDETGEAFRRIYHAHPLPMWIYDPWTLRILEVNDAAVRAYGFTRDEFLRMTLRELRPLEDVPRLERVMEEERERRDPHGVGIWRHRRKTGETFDVEITVCPVRWTGGAANAAMVQDLSVGRGAAAALAESEARYQALVDLSPQAVAVADLDFRLMAASQQAAALLGRGRPEELVGRSGLDFIVKQDHERLRKNAERVVTEGVLRDEEYTLLRHDGTTFTAEVSASLLRDSGGGPKAFIAVIRDLTQQRETEAQLRHYAFHDTLTSLPNAALFREHVSRSVARSGRQDAYRFAVLLLNLDRFQTANETLGRHGGDMLLLSVSARLRDAMRPGDILARYGGDEFGILLNGVRDTDEALAVAERVHATLKPAFNMYGQELHVSASVGVAMNHPGHGQAEDVLRDASAALAKAKGGGKSRSVVFAEGMHTSAAQLVRLENDLRRAVERLEFCLYYQPVVSLKTSAPVGVEALVRWKHPTRDLVLPAEFIPMAEETGLIEPIGAWAIRTACGHRQGWTALGRLPVRVSVNVSARQFRQDLPRLVEAALTESGLPAESLSLEITESVAMEDLAYSVTVLNDLARMGVEILIDDFGVAYSSLNYLKRFPISTVKIDRSFIRDLPTSSDDAAITRAIIAMAHSLNLKVVAEGVETEEQLGLVRKFGADFVQGFLLSPPVPADELGQLLARKQPFPALKR